jgi:HEAT repeat protein
VAGTPAAIGTLQNLSNDSDKQVRAATQQALSELSLKKP